MAELNQPGSHLGNYCRKLASNLFIMLNKGGVMSGLQTAMADFVHLFFPHLCAGCGSDVLTLEHHLCLRCIAELPVTHFFDKPGNPVEAKFYGRLNLNNAASGFYLTKDSLMESLIYELKYKGNKSIGYYLGELLGNYLKNSRFEGAEAIIPLPLNARRFKKRGYNQSQILCEGICHAWNRQIVNDAVIRKVNTETQTHRGRINRWKNMDGVFAVANPDALIDKHILLVDDVVTTGASIEACGAEILKVPGTTLSVVTLAYTI
jgi:ComF family protein